jgi:hypothetical protein
VFLERLIPQYQLLRSTIIASNCVCIGMMTNLAIEDRERYP